MIDIKELRALRGPNRHTRHTAISMVLDIQDYEERPSDRIEGFPDRLLALIPTLQNHECSIGKPGGFVQRLHRGTWAGHIIEHLAIELQCLAGMEVGYGKTLGTSVKGVYIVVFRYLVESVGLYAAEAAVSIFECLAEAESCDIDQVISQLKILREENMLGPTTRSIVEEARSRGIPSIRLNEDSHVQLGYGAHQKQIQASISSQTSAIAVESADDKTRVKLQLEKSGIPVPAGQLVTSEAEAVAAFASINGAVVVKPNVGNHGKGASIEVINLEHLKMAFQAAKMKHDEVIVEEHIQGHDFRLLVIDGALVAAAKREPAHVVGDGKSSIGALIEGVNSDSLRGFGHEKVLTRIEVDDMTERLLLNKGLTLESRPGPDETIYLKATGNLSQGGTAADVTDIVHPEIRLMAERTAQIIGLDCAGVDVLAEDISLPLEPSGVHVIEVNAAPGFRMHLAPTTGKPRNVAKPFVEMLFRQSYASTPVIAVTGTNGKTTTCKLIAHTLKYSGKKVGLACTTGIEIDGVSVLSGDYSGPEGAGVVIRDPTVNHIVLEVARGGIVRRGLGVQEVDIGVLLNIGHDHVGTDWIETQDDLRLVKSTVVEVVKSNGSSVLNADDDVTWSVRDRARGNLVLFSLDCENPRLKEHALHGGTVVTVQDRNVLIRKDQVDLAVCKIEEIPITYNGIVDFNISNALAAIGALFGLNLPIEQIRNGVTTFFPSATQNPGRMNLFDFQSYKVLVDYGHNPESARALSKLIPRLALGRKVALCHGTGSRTDEQIVDFGRALASVYDHIVLADFDPRDRPLGETPELVREGLIAEGFPDRCIEIVSKPEGAVDYIFSIARAGDLIVIQPDDLEPIMSQVLEKHRLMLL